MKVYIKGKELKDWKEVLNEETTNRDFIGIVAAYYIEQEYDVKVKQK